MRMLLRVLSRILLILAMPLLIVVLYIGMVCAMIYHILTAEEL